jgi:hypothetical protein
LNLGYRPILMKEFDSSPVHPLPIASLSPSAYVPNNA